MNIKIFDEDMYVLTKQLKGEILSEDEKKILININKSVFTQISTDQIFHEFDMKLENLETYILNNIPLDCMRVECVKCRYGKYDKCLLQEYRDQIYKTKDD